MSVCVSFIWCFSFLRGWSQVACLCKVWFPPQYIPFPFSVIYSPKHFYFLIGFKLHAFLGHRRISIWLWPWSRFVTVLDVCTGHLSCTNIIVSPKGQGIEAYRWEEHFIFYWLIDWLFYNSIYLSRLHFPPCFSVFTDIMQEDPPRISQVTWPLLAVTYINCLSYTKK